MSSMNRNCTPVDGQMMGTMGKPTTTGTRLENMSMPPDQAICTERTTGFEPATLTLAEKNVKRTLRRVRPVP